MKSAEGTVQEKKYDASFPCLINVNGQPTYIMVLKDSGGLVKMYAMVNVEQYNVVATGTTQADVFANYKKKMKTEGNKTGSSNSENPVEDEVSVVLTISDIQYIVSDGETTVYLKDSTGKVYKQAFAENEELITLNVGDRIKAYIVEEEDVSIITMTGFEMISKGSIDQSVQ